MIPIKSGVRRTVQFPIQCHCAFDLSPLCTLNLSARRSPPSPQGKDAVVFGKIFQIIGFTLLNQIDCLLGFLHSIHNFGYGLKGTTNITGKICPCDENNILSLKISDTIMILIHITIISSDTRLVLVKADWKFPFVDKEFLR